MNDYCSCSLQFKMYLEFLFCATFSLCAPAISSRGLLVEEKPSLHTNNELLLGLVGNVNDSTKTTNESALTLTNHNETNTQEETTDATFMKLLDKTRTLNKEAVSNHTANFQNTTVSIKFNAQLVKITNKDCNSLSTIGLVPIIVNEKSTANQILLSDEAKTLENQTHTYATNPNFVENLDLLVSKVEPQPHMSEEISEETAELPPRILGPTGKENIEAIKAENPHILRAYVLPNDFETTQLTAEWLNADTTNLEKNLTLNLGGAIEPSGQAYAKPAKISVDLPERHVYLGQNKMETQLLHNTTNRVEHQESQVYNSIASDLRALPSTTASDFEENSTSRILAFNATTTRAVSPISRTVSNSVAGVGNTKIKQIFLSNFTAGTAMKRPIEISNRPKEVQAPSAWYTNLIAFHPVYLLNPFNYFYNSTNQNIFEFVSPASSWHYSNLFKPPVWDFTNLFYTPFLTGSSSSARHKRGFFRRPNATKLHFFPVFKLFNSTARFNRTKFASKTNIKLSVNTSALLSGLFPPTYVTSEYLQESQGRSAAGNNAEVYKYEDNSEQLKDTTILRYSNASPFYSSEANQLRTPVVMFIGGRPQYYQRTPFSNNHLQRLREISFLDQHTPTSHSDHPYSKQRSCTADRRNSVDVTVSEAGR